MLEFKIRQEHEIVQTLLMLCQMTKHTSPLAYQQYQYQLNILKDYLMKEFESEQDEDV
jgi:hypothetical protein